MKTPYILDKNVVGEICIRKADMLNKEDVKEAILQFESLVKDLESDISYLFNTLRYPIWKENIDKGLFIKQLEEDKISLEIAKKNLAKCNKILELMNG